MKRAQYRYDEQLKQFVELKDPSQASQDAQEKLYADILKREAAELRLTHPGTYL